MIARWSKLQEDLPQYFEVIEAGIEKLSDYQSRLTDVPVYTLSICKLSYFNCFVYVHFYHYSDQPGDET